MASGSILDALTIVFENGAVLARRGRASCKSLRNSYNLKQLQRKQDVTLEVFWKTASSDRLLSELSDGMFAGAKLPVFAAEIVAERNLDLVLGAMDDAGLLPGDEAGLQALFELALDARDAGQTRCPAAMGMWFLSRACSEGDIDLIRMLLADARVDPAHNECWAFSCAACYGQTEVVRLLMEDGRADPSYMGNDALSFACDFGHLDVVRLLLADARVDPAAAPSTKDPIIGAVRGDNGGHTEIVRLLLADGRASPCTDDDEAIRYASSRNYIDIVRLLLADPRVNPAACDNEAIRTAHDRGHREVVELLLADGRPSRGC